MHLYRQMKIQLAVFVVIAIIAISVLAIGYGHALSSVFGVGRYGVTVNLSQSGGLNERANVTYRGVDVGRVDAVRLTTTGVSVSLSLNTRFDIPSDVDAAVHSQSVVGEQFIELVPRDTTSRALRDGDVISVDRTSVPRISINSSTTPTLLSIRYRTITSRPLSMKATLRWGVWVLNSVASSMAPATLPEMPVATLLS